MTPPEEENNPVNWSIRLVGAEADQWDDLLYSLRKETGRRTLSKADIMRALVDLASNEPELRSALIDALTHTR
ncbi:hypothetical protein [Mycobacterium intracellulare]|uniref:hypothetical protein n=1 Tax=Mycobacterium intracellulare TaxID=1767 RepID=UPI001EEE14D4|nr:hypothetical protein [Mycobacterium intracellulare]MEE3755365.1 hypothetical protein [Mycobacterium intracellulare]